MSFDGLHSPWKLHQNGSHRAVRTTDLLPKSRGRSQAPVPLGALPEPIPEGSFLLSQESKAMCLQHQCVKGLLSGRHSFCFPERVLSLSPRATFNKNTRTQNRRNQYNCDRFHRTSEHFTGIKWLKKKLLGIPWRSSGLDSGLLLLRAWV